MVLGTLARHGQQHGHQIRRIAEITNVGEWGGVSVGALYRELRSMEGEGLVSAVRTERVGRRPARTVYEITGEGHLELGLLRERAINGLHLGPDPLGVALTFAGDDADREELASWLRARREMLAISAGQLQAERGRLIARGLIDPMAAAVMRRGEMHLEAEVSWHDEFAKVIARLSAGEPADVSAQLSGTGQPGTDQPGTDQPGTGQPGTDQLG
jgi:DNA-binding PadR family transcriptional regulator